MSDAISSQTALDPNRPWIEHEEELPANMNWLDTFLNPVGESPKLHFTRAWTVLFFAGFITWVGIGFAIFILGAAGSNTGGLSAFHGYMIAAVIGVSSLLSYVIHARRLNHAGKTSLWALIVLVPLVVGAVLFMGGVAGKAAEYQKHAEARAEYVQDPAAWRENRLEERRAAQAEAQREREQANSGNNNPRQAATQSSGNRPGQRQRRGRGGGGPGGGEGGYNPENALPTQEAFIIRPNLQSFYGPIVLLNLFIMIWSLTWVARVPNFNRKPEEQLAYR